MAQASSKHFRLLDLPAELRVQIFEYAFDDDSPEEVDVFQLGLLLPQPALTVVSKLVHGDCRSSLESAYQRFWRTHTLCSERSEDVPLNLAGQWSRRRVELCARMSKLPPIDGGTTIKFRRGVLISATPYSDGLSIAVSLSGTGDIIIDIDEPAEHRLQARAEESGQDVSTVRAAGKHVRSTMGHRWELRYDKYVGGGSRSGLSVAAILFALV